MNYHYKSSSNRLTPASPLPPILETHTHPPNHPQPYLHPHLHPHPHPPPPPSFHPQPDPHMRYYTHHDDYAAQVRRRYSTDVTGSRRPAPQPHQQQQQPHRSSSGDKDESPGRRGPAQPLRRGDACLMCRAKKLKCSATKPVCDQCTKRKDRCVYDAVRPASRVEKLEKKLAEIEEAELRAALAAKRQCAETTIPSTYPSLQPALTPSFDLTMYPFHGQPASAAMAVSASTGVNSFSAADVNSFSAADVARPQSMPTPQIDPLASWNWSDTSFSSLPSAASPAMQPPWSVINSTTDVSPWDGDPLGLTNATVSPSTEPTPSSLYGMPQELPSIGSLNMNDLLFAPIASSLLQPDISALPGVTPNDARAAVDDVLDHAASYAVQLDEKDISQSARDYLLDLFFCPPRERWGCEVFSEAQFRAKMLLPPRSRPHPCLVFAMYTLAASSSYIPAVRSLSESLYEIAKSKVEASVTAEDRLVDAVNACKMLSKWLITRARALEAHHMCLRAGVLAMACNLHKIPSSAVPIQPASATATATATASATATTTTTAGQGSLANPWPLIGAPKDQWDMCERIHAFWAAWGNDRGASVAMPWPTCMRDDLILTPLPRAPDDYMNGTIHRVPDFYLRDVYMLPHRPELELPTFAPALLCIAVHLVARSKHLASNQTEHDQTFLALGAKAAQSPAGRFHARRDSPRAFKEIGDAIDAMFARMPASHRINLLESPPWPQSGVPLTHVLLLAAKYWLYDNDTDAHDREVALAQAREIAGIIRLWIKQLKLDEIRDTRNVKFTSRATGACGCAETYVLTPWYWAADWLVRGGHGLRGEGRNEEAQGSMDDAAMIVAALRSLGAIYPPPTNENADLVDKASMDLDQQM